MGMTAVSPDNEQWQRVWGLVMSIAATGESGSPIIPYSTSMYRKRFCGGKYAVVQGPRSRSCSAVASQHEPFQPAAALHCSRGKLVST